MGATGVHVVVICKVAESVSCATWRMDSPFTASLNTCVSESADRNRVLL